MAVANRLRSSRFDGLQLVAGLLILWQIGYWLAGDLALTSPWRTMQQLGAMLADPRFLPHLLETLAAFAQGFAIAVLLGVSIGAALGAHRLTGEVSEPILVALYSIPKVTLYPIVLLVFGIGMPAKVAFGAIQGVVPIAIFTMNAVRQIPSVYLRTARIYRMSPYATARRVLLPAALPEIISGIRVGFALSLVGTLLGEMFGAQRGLGFLLMQAMTLHNMPRIMALTLLLVILAVVINLLLLAFDRRLNARIGVALR